ncbi:hypothetical protein [Frankia torreyi]|uniref:hypothetical protein n=1 Tax=Frankia torreyi TaxID=1856 RepID=UPI001A7E4EDE|nr:hypothetical protein [Frankia torreyi]
MAQLGEDRELAIAGRDGEDTSAPSVHVSGVLEQGLVCGVGLGRHRPGRDSEFSKHGDDAISGRIVLGVAGHDVMDCPGRLDERADPASNKLGTWSHRSNGVLDVDQQDAVIGLHPPMIAARAGFRRQKRLIAPGPGMRQTARADARSRLPTPLPRLPGTPTGCEVSTVLNGSFVLVDLATNVRTGTECRSL